MKTPWYEIAPGATAALLASRVFVDGDLYTFTLPGAVGGVSVLRYGAGPVDVTVAGTTWPANQVTFDQDKAKAVAHWKVGLDTDTWQVVVAPRNVDIRTGAPDPDTIGTAPFLAALRAGALDGAEVQIDRAFAAAWPAPGKAMAPAGVVTIFYGRVAEIDVGRSQAVITIASHLKLLAAQMPRLLYQAACIHTLFGAGCNVAGSLPAASFAVAGTIAAVSADGATITATLAAPGGSGTYALGRMVMASGSSEGFARSIRSYTAGTPATLTLIAPFALGVVPGDAFTAYPGCDKTFAACGKFANQQNYGGELNIPAPEVAF